MRILAVLLACMVALAACGSSNKGILAPESPVIEEDGSMAAKLVKSNKAGGTCEKCVGQLFGESIDSQWPVVRATVYWFDGTPAGKYESAVVFKGEFTFDKFEHYWSANVGDNGRGRLEQDIIIASDEKHHGGSGRYNVTLAWLGAGGIFEGATWKNVSLQAGQVYDLVLMPNQPIVTVRNMQSIYLRGGILGDVNSDGKLTAVDALFLLQEIHGKRALNVYQVAAGDLNHDGALTEEDLPILMKKIVE